MTFRLHLHHLLLLVELLLLLQLGGLLARDPLPFSVELHGVIIVDVLALWLSLLALISIKVASLSAHLRPTTHGAISVAMASK